VVGGGAYFSAIPKMVLQNPHASGAFLGTRRKSAPDPLPRSDPSIPSLRNPAGVGSDRDPAWVKTSRDRGTWGVSSQVDWRHRAAAEVSDVYGTECETTPTVASGGAASAIPLLNPAIPAIMIRMTTARRRPTVVLQRLHSGDT
jgi:hypothetical protein